MQQAVRCGQSEESGIWILMTSTRRKWGERVWGESALNLPLSPSACLSLTYGPHACSLSVFTGFVSLWFWLISRQWTNRGPECCHVKDREDKAEETDSCCCRVLHVVVLSLHSSITASTHTGTMLVSILRHIFNRGSNVCVTATHFKVNNQTIRCGEAGMPNGG